MRQPLTGLPHNVHADMPTRVTTVMYVDDGKIYVASKSLATNIKILSVAYTQAAAWLQSAGLAPDTEKRELMHYTRRKQDAGLSPPITLQELDGSTTAVHPAQHVRWLGVHFDQKLSFDYHVKMAADKAMVAVGRMDMLANTVRGLSQLNLRCLYKACVFPILAYAAAAWWPSRVSKGKLIGKKKHEKVLAKIQRRALLIICAAFRTTPTEALELESSIPPIRHLLDQAVRDAGI